MSFSQEGSAANRCFCNEKKNGGSSQNEGPSCLVIFE